jgi:hypothetical protein
MENPAMAVVHPRIAEGGGSEASALWMLEALQDEGRLTLITMGRPDFGALNRAYGTGVDGRKVACRPLPVPAGMGRRFDALRGWRLARYCRRYASEFDVMISAYNVMDFGRPGIQRIGDFSFDDRLRRMLYPSRGVEGRLIYHRSPWRSAYLASSVGASVSIRWWSIRRPCPSRRGSHGRSARTASWSWAGSFPRRASMP